MRSVRKFFKALSVVKGCVGGGVSGGGPEVINVQRHKLTYFINVRGEKNFKVDHFLTRPASLFPYVNDS